MPLLSLQSAKGYGFGKLSQAGYATGNFVSLQTAYGTGSNSTITFSAIPQTFKHLRIFAIHKGTASYDQGIYTIQLNGDTGNNYNSGQQVGQGGGGAVNAVSLTGTNGIYSGSSSFYYNSFCSSTTSAMGVSVIDVLDYTSTDGYKTVSTFDGKERGTSDSNSRIVLGTGTWANTTAVTSISFKIYDESLSATNFTSTTRFALYGITG